MVISRIIGLLFVSVLMASAKVPEMPTMPEGAEPPGTFQDLIDLYQAHGVNVHYPKIELEEGVTRLLDIPFVTRGEQELKLDLFLPAEPYTNSPLVILVYGGGFRMGDKKKEHPKAHWLVNRGYAVACVQYRLSGVASFPAPLNDLKAAVSWLRKNAAEYGYNSEKIAMFGGSAGGHLTSLVASTVDSEDFEHSEVSNAIQAAIVVGTPPDMNSPYGISESRKEGSDYRMFLGVSYDDHPEVVNQASTSHHLSENTPPSLLIDEHFNPSSAPVRDKLAEWGTTHDYLVLSGGIHGEWQFEPWFTITLDRADKFLKKLFGPNRMTVRGAGLLYPESIQYDPEEDVYLVSNIEGGFDVKDGKGFISKFRPDGSLVDLKWIDAERDELELHAPKGMVAHVGLLYVADIDQVHVFELPEGTLRRSIPVKGSAFLNAIAPGPGDSVFVTDSGIKWNGQAWDRIHTDAIYQVWANGRTKTVVKDVELDRPNGIVRDGDDLLVVTISGRLLRIKTDGTWSEFPSPPIDGLDGLVLLEDGRLLMSSYKASAVLVKHTDHRYETLVSDLAVPADIGYDTKRQRILVPRLLDGEIDFINP